MSEASLTKKVKDFLDSFPKHELWYYKASDRFTSGVPDFIVCYRGEFVAIELKDTNKKPKPIQEYTMRCIDNAQGCTIWTDNFEDVKNFFKNLHLKPYPELLNLYAEG